MSTERTPTSASIEELWTYDDDDDPKEDTTESETDDNEDSIHSNISLPPCHTALTSSITKAGIFGTSSNLINTIVGAGIVGIPFALKESGFIAGVLLLIFVGVMTEKSLRMLIDITFFHPIMRQKSISSYEDLFYCCFGRIGRGFILISMFVMAYGAMVAYLIIIKDTVPTMIGFESTLEKRLTLVITSLVVILPLSLQRDMASLACTSILSVSCDIILVIFVMLYAPLEESVFEEHGGIMQIIINDSVSPNVFLGLGVISMAMCCQHSVFLIYNSLENGTKWRWGVVTSISISTATVCTILMGIAGYLGFMEKTQGDVLNNFPASSIQANISRGLLAITMFFTYPMESFVARHVLVDLFHNGDMENIAGNVDRSRLNRMLLNRRERMTIMIYITTLIPALFFEDLGPVLSISGAVGASCLAYIAPGMAYLGVNGNAFLDFSYGLVDQQYKEEIELPVAGNRIVVSNCTSRQPSDTLELPVSGTPTEMITTSPPPTAFKCKPIWWYILGMPIWCGIASYGNARLSRHIHRTSGDNTESSDTSNQPRQEELHPPTMFDFIIAIFFIIFGMVALACGLGTNILIQMNKYGGSIG